LFGEVFDTKGAPVLAVLELEPIGRGNMSLDLIKIASAYGKDTNPQSLINNSEILYIDPNKNRTDNWLTSTGLQLPVGVNQYGSINKVTYSNVPVKTSIRGNGENNVPVSQKINSARTSLKQVPALFKDRNVKFGKVNIDIGGGRYNLYL